MFNWSRRSVHHCFLMSAVGAALVSSQLVEAAPSIRLVSASSNAPNAAVVVLTVDPVAYDTLWRGSESWILGFPLPDGSDVDLEVTAFFVTSPGARFTSGSLDEPYRFTPPSMRFFQGTAAGMPGSSVYLWLRDGRIGGSLRLPTADDRKYESIRFGPRSPRFAEAMSREIVISRALARAPMTVGAYCGADALAPPTRTEHVREPADEGILPSTVLRATVAVDTTVEYHDHFGNVADASAYLMSLFAEISAIYERDIEIQVPLGNVRIFDAEPDPYRTTTSSSALLSDVRDEWRTNPAVQDLPRAVTHLITRVGGMGGIAYVDQLCSKTNGYGVSSVRGTYSYPDPEYTWDVDVVSHELGHNFGSHHTHCYVPEIDQCYNGDSSCYTGPVNPTTGTIMSYCHITSAGKSLDFHSRVVDVIRSLAETSVCLEAAGNPGRIRTDLGDGLKLAKGFVDQDLISDDGSGDSSAGYGGGAQAAWVKRFAPPCPVFQLTRVDLQVSSSSIATGRGIRALVYSDPGASGDPSTSTLVFSEDTTVQVVSSSDWNRYSIRPPVVVTSGDFYVGFYDLDTDPETSYIMRGDSAAGGDSFQGANSTAPSAYSPVSSKTWMIRATGNCGDRAITFSWTSPCNETSVPGQDFGLYEGTIGGRFDDHLPLTCTTARLRTFTSMSFPSGSTFYAVVPSSSAAEGDYGSIPPSAAPCKPQAIGTCD